MTRQEHLAFCKKCINREMDPNQGFICGITKKIADFENECENFEQDRTQSEVQKTTYKQNIKDNSKRASIAINVFWVICGLNLIAVVSSYFELELLERINGGYYVSDEEANANDLRQGIIGLLQTGIYIVSIITFLNWFRRAYGNLHRSGAHLEYREEMAAWAFFIPFVNLYRPFQIAKEIAKVNSQRIAELSKNDYNSPGVVVIGIWWALFLITNWIGNIAFKMVLRGGDTLADLISQSQVYLVSDLLDISAAFFTLQMIKKISAQENLIQEQVRRL